MNSSRTNNFPINCSYYLGFCSTLTCLKSDPWSVPSFSGRRNSFEKSRSLRGTLRGRSLHGGRSSELSGTLFGTLFPWLGRSVFAKIAKKALFPAKTAVFAGKNGFFADFREKSSAKHAFFLKKIGCVRENIISALPRSLFAWGRSAVALSVCRSLRVSLRGTLFKQVKVI